MIPACELGLSGLEVSRLALGSWRTFERLSSDEGVAVMVSAREAGITFLDDARYNDETGTAPIPTGFSEVLFGQLFRAAGWVRDEVVVANKLWWEFWPDETAAAELEGSLSRMELDHLDLVYSAPLPDGLDVGTCVAEVSRLISSGKVRAWGVVNWPASQLAEAVWLADAQGVARPCAAQLPYSLLRRSPVEDDDMVAVLDRTGIGVVASYVLAGGALTGKYAAGAGSGRLSDQLDDPRTRRALDAADRLQAFAQGIDATPAATAIAFALANDHVASVLFGATSPAQVAENVAALDVAARLDQTQLTALRAMSFE